MPDNGKNSTKADSSQCLVHLLIYLFFTFMTRIDSLTLTQYQRLRNLLYFYSSTLFFLLFSSSSPPLPLSFFNYQKVIFSLNDQEEKFINFCNFPLMCAIHVVIVSVGNVKKLKFSKNYKRNKLILRSIFLKVELNHQFF